MSRIGHRIDQEKDYIIYKRGTNHIAHSRDQAYPDYGPDASLENIIENCFTARSAVGCIIHLQGSAFTLDDTVSIPTTDNKTFGVIGDGLYNTIVTLDAAFSGTKAFLGGRGTWDTPQIHSTFLLKDIGFNLNNEGTGLVQAPFTIPIIDNLYVIPNVPNGNTIIYYGGASGPSYASDIGTIVMDYTGNDRRNTLLSLWLDTVDIKHLAFAFNINLNTQIALSFVGEHYNIGNITAFHGGGGSLDVLMYVDAADVNVGRLVTITGGGGSTMNGIIQATSGSQITVQNIRRGDANHTMFKDATSQSLTRFGWTWKGTGSIDSGATTDAITHGCPFTPSLEDIKITWGEQGTSDYGRWWVDNIGAATFQVNVTADPGASNLDFAWEVAK